MNHDSLRLVAKIKFTGRIVTLTGLHIGGSDVGLKIGGADQVVVKDPKTGRPYIPGSSLKGKIRCLLEKAGFCCDGNGIDIGRHRRRLDRAGEMIQVPPCKCGKCKVCELFGIPADAIRELGQEKGVDRVLMGRLIFRDAPLDEECARRMDSWRYISAPYVEIKTEVAIDRLTSAANPRNFERVPANAEFRFETIMDIWDNDPVAEYISLFLEGFRLLANDYLGGNGTRGYGAVRIILEDIRKIDLTKAGSDFTQWTPDGISVPWVEPPYSTEVTGVSSSNT